MTMTIEPTGEKDTGICPDCGNRSRVVWGLAHSGKRCVAAYYVHWTLSHIRDSGANFDLVLGPWGEHATARDRQAIALAYRLMEPSWSMMVIDASTRPFARDKKLIGRALGRDEVIGTPLAEEAFAIADAILAQDTRVAELLGP